MKDWMSDYLDLIVRQRDWSWTVVVILYLVASLTVRSWFLGPVIRRAKTVAPKHYQRIKRGYLKKSIWGWLSFLVSSLFVIGLWQMPLAFPLNLKDSVIILGAIASFLFAIFLHLLALTIAVIQTLKEVEESETRLSK